MASPTPISNFDSPNDTTVPSAFRGKRQAGTVTCIRIHSSRGRTTGSQIGETLVPGKVKEIVNFKYF